MSLFRKLSFVLELSLNLFIDAQFRIKLLLLQKKIIGSYRLKNLLDYLVFDYVAEL